MKTKCHEKKIKKKNEFLDKICWNPFCKFAGKNEGLPHPPQLPTKPYTPVDSYKSKASKQPMIKSSGTPSTTSLTADADGDFKKILE